MSAAARLPAILYYVQTLLRQEKVAFSKETTDGRINSCIDENTVVSFLQTKIGPENIRIPQKRMWYDISLRDEVVGWIPVNIKTTTMNTSDNTGNLAMCVQAYTDMELDLDKTCENGKMSDILIRYLKEGRYNRQENKDYYFLVLNKCVPEDVIVNSVLGLTVLTPNVNNLPFQICWNKNREYAPKPIETNIQMFLNCMQKPRPSWKEAFMCEVRKLAVDTMEEKI
jgi:hypothetical protein